jgi:hypothetical protein
MKLVGNGLILGILGALGLTRALTAQLYEVKASDPTTFVAVSMTLLGVSVACLVAKT